MSDCSILSHIKKLERKTLRPTIDKNPKRLNIYTMSYKDLLLSLKFAKMKLKQAYNWALIDQKSQWDLIA